MTALGGPGNLTSVDACAMRLRLVVASQDAVDPSALKRLGARATVKVSSSALQVVLGPIADQIAGEMRALLRAPAAATATTAPQITPEVLSRLLFALGGRENIREIEAVASTRLWVRVANGMAVDPGAIRSLGLRGVAQPAPDCVHVVVGAGVEEALARLRALVGA